MKNLKVKQLITVSILGLSMGLLAGCGKSERDKAVDAYQEELGLSKDEAEDLADAFAGFSGDEPIDDSDNPVQQEEESQIELVEPSSQIVNSNIKDPIIQVYNAVIPLDGSITVGEMINRVNEGTDFEVNYGEINENSLAEVSESWLSGEANDKNGEVMFKFQYINPENAPIKVYDCPVLDISSGSSKHSVNIFYAGNLCDATFNPYIEGKVDIE